MNHPAFPLRRLVHSNNRRPLTVPVGRLIAAASLMMLATSPAWPQAHARQFDAYTLRSSTAGTEDLPEETARKHGITRDPRLAVLNVTVSKKDKGLDKTVPAKVHAHARNLSGHRREIDMREITAEGRVSYMGTYQFVHGEVLDFTIAARPVDSDSTLTMTYRDRLWAGGDLPDQPPKRP